MNEDDTSKPTRPTASGQLDEPPTGPRAARSKPKTAKADTTSPGEKSRSTSRSRSHAHAQSNEPAAQAEPKAEPTGDGQASSAAAMQQAEVLLDQAGERLGKWASQMSLQLRRAAALAREEAEDIWAEAQALRNKG